jgi:tetratricopeptide (TPR) repeat protein
MSQILELAMIAFEGENFSDAYEKFSKVIENDLNNKDGWIFKGLCASYLASPGAKGFKESLICLKKAEEIGLEENEKTIISKHIISSSKVYVEKIFKLLKEAQVQSESKPMATGELYSVRDIRLLVERMSALIDNWDNFKIAIDFSKESLRYSNNVSTAKDVLGIIDIIHGKSTEKNSSPKYLPELEAIRKEIVSIISSFEPNYTPPPVKSSSDGCFIATAIYGDYDAPEVMELRKFRDNILKKSWFGRSLIKIYYSKSPALAEKAKNKKWLKNGLKLFLVEPARLIIKLF